MNGWVLLHGHPGWLAAAAAVAALSVASWVAGTRGVSRGRRAVLLAVRLLAVAAAVAAVLRPARETDLTRPLRPPLVVVVDTSRSMTAGDPAPGPAAARWLERAADRLTDLDRVYRVEVVGLGDPPPALDPAAAAGAFRGDETPLARTLEGLARARPGCAGAILLTDGRDTERPGAPPAGLSFPVYPVVLPGRAVSDLWVERVDTPPVAFIRTPVEVRVVVGRSGLEPGPAVVTLLEADTPLASVSAELDGPLTEVGLSFTPTRVGRKAYRVEVTPWPGEATDANNRARFGLNVIRDKTRVLLVAGTPTWDVKFLRRRLRQDPGVDLITFLILRTPQDLTLVPQDELSLIPFPTRELFSEELPSFDAVIFANFDYAPYVPRRYLENLVRFVREAGGGFAMLGGDRSFGLGGYQGGPLAEILPVDLSGAAPGRAYLAGPFRPRRTDAGRAHPLLQWFSDPADNDALWAALPELENQNWALRARPGAVVLAENPERRNEYGPLPVIALGEYGAGRTLAVTTDSLWRWSLPYAGAGGAGEPYRDFWTRALRWLVHDPEMERVRLSLPPPPVRAGRPVVFRARVFDPSYQPATGAGLTGRLEGAGGRTVDLVWEEAGPGEYAARPVTVPAAGSWRASVEARLDGRTLGRDAAEFPVEPASLEGLRVGVDRDYLDRLARESGGAVYDADDPALLDRLERAGEARVEVVGRRLDEVWPRGWLLLATVGLFGLDWLLRRWWT